MQNKDFFGLNCPPLGFGCMRLPTDEDKKIDMEQTKAMVDAFIQNGFKYFDTAYYYHGRTSEQAVREALVKRYDRSAFYLADKMPLTIIQTTEDYEKEFVKQLENTGVTYFDFYMLHNLSKGEIEKTIRLGGFEFLQKVKADGRAKYVGFSFHSTADKLEEVLSAYPFVDFVQLQINYLDWENESVQSRLCYETAVRHGKQVVVMEPLKGGMLCELPEKIDALFRAKKPGDSQAAWGLRFAASLENVFMVLSGMSNLEQVRDNIAVMKNFLPLEEEEQQIILKAREILNDSLYIQCTACKYCVAGCPVNINIPTAFVWYNTFKQFGNLNNARMRYDLGMYGGGKASECIACGNCEEACPQNLPIRELLVLTAQALE